MLLVAHMCETTSWKSEIGDRNLLLPREAIVESNEQPDFVYAVIPSSCYAKKCQSKPELAKCGRIGQVSGYESGPVFSLHVCNALEFGMLPSYFDTRRLKIGALLSDGRLERCRRDDPDTGKQYL